MKILHQETRLIKLTLRVVKYDDSRQYGYDIFIPGGMSIVHNEGFEQELEATVEGSKRLAMIKANLRNTIIN